MHQFDTPERSPGRAEVRKGRGASGETGRGGGQPRPTLRTAPSPSAPIPYVWPGERTCGRRKKPCRRSPGNPHDRLQRPPFRTRHHPDRCLLSVRDQCQAADVAFTFKQWGAWGPDGIRRDKRRPTVDCWRGGCGRNGRNPVGCYCRRRNPHRFPNDLPLTMHSSRTSERTRRTHPSRSMLVPSRSRTGSMHELTGAPPPRRRGTDRQRTGGIVLDRIGRRYLPKLVSR